MKRRAKDRPARHTGSNPGTGHHTSNSRLRTWLVCALLAALAIAAYRQAGTWGFVNLDDDAYVEFQPMVNQGLRPAAVVWALTATHSNNWHPLTSLSHMLDCSLFDLTPGPMHWENVLWHALNALIVFLVWQSATGATWRSAMVAGLFAFHPAHVESVAWISERKDVLSTFFWLLGLAAYVRYSRAPSTKRYLLVATFLVLGLLSKPMVVTFPLVLLLLDYWPLRRWPAMSWRRLMVEKIPLFALVVAHSIVTLVVQVSTGASHYGERFSLAARLGNAGVSCVRYVGKSVWTDPLSPHYAHPGWWPAWAVMGALIVVVLVSALAWRQRRSWPWLMFGWLWFLATLLPVIGIVQVGEQAMADRYTYVPYLGLFTAGVWAFGAIAMRFQKFRIPMAAASILVLGICVALTQRQASTWKDSITLYERSISAGVDNAPIRYLLAVAFQSARYPAEVVAAQFRRALDIKADYTNALTQLAMLAVNRQDFAEGERLVMETIRLEPSNPAFSKNLGVLRNMQGKPEAAAALFGEALRLDPNYTEANHELAWMYLKADNLAAAARQLEIVARASPWDHAEQCELGVVYLRLGRREDARRCFERALWINPKYAEAERNLRLLAETKP